MRLIRRLTLYLFVIVAMILAADTALILREHYSLFEADLRRDERHLGAALAFAVERAWRDHGEAYARAIVAGADDPLGAIRIRFVRLGSPEGAPDAPGVPISVSPETAAQVVHTRGAERAYTYVPLSIPSQPGAALEVSESLGQERAYLRSRVRSELRTAALMALAFGGVAWVLGVRVVGRPIRALVDKARRVGAGDFSGPLALRQRDELAHLAREMNVMAEHLEAARQKVAVESEARIAALQQLRHADRLTTVGELASGLAHELGTPLNVVSGRARMISAGELEGPAEIVRAAETIADQADRMAGIVRQLLDFARRRSSERRAADVSAIARQTAELLGPMAAQQQVALDCAGAEEPLRAPVDPGQIQQALANIVVNAIQAMKRPGIVAVRTRAAELSAEGALHPAGPYAVIQVTDQGDGIRADQLPAIFVPFFTTKPVGEGTGLGLSVAYAIVREHGGWIDVESEPGRGSAFQIWLPCGAAA
jgi:signal transduction histidine kinase